MKTYIFITFIIFIILLISGFTSTTISNTNNNSQIEILGTKLNCLERSVICSFIYEGEAWTGYQNNTPHIIFISDGIFWDVEKIILKEANVKNFYPVNTIKEPYRFLGKSDILKTYKDKNNNIYFKYSEKSKIPLSPTDKKLMIERTKNN